jgi:hypothetical protein
MHSTVHSVDTVDNVLSLALTSHTFRQLLGVHLPPPACAAPSAFGFISAPSTDDVDPSSDAESADAASTGSSAFSFIGSSAAAEGEGNTTAEESPAGALAFSFVNTTAPATTTTVPASTPPARAATVVKKKKKKGGFKPGFDSKFERPRPRGWFDYAIRGVAVRLIMQLEKWLSV